MKSARPLFRGSECDTGFEPVIGSGRRQGAGVTLAALFLGTFSAISNAAPDYQADIAPLLRQYCAGCHNDDDFEGDFSVERFADLKEGGSKGVMLKAGDPEGSYLVRLMTGGASEPMPPKDEPQPSAEEIAIFKNWIVAGARGPKPEDDLSILSTLTVPEIPPGTGAAAITAIDRSADGLLFAEARFGLVEIMGKTGGFLEKLPGKINAVHFSSDGTRLLTASGITGLNGVATLWDLKTRKKIREFGKDYHRDVLYDAEFSPDGKLIATAGYDAKIALWNAGTGERIRTIEVHNGAIFDLAFSPDGAVLASASGDSTVKLWKVDTGQRLDTLNQPQGEQFAVAFSPDGNFIFAGGADNRIRMWRFVSRDKPQINPVRQARFAHEDAVVGLALSKDGKWLASTSDDRSVKLWSLPGLTQVRAWENQPDVAAAVLFAGNEIVLGRMDGSRQVLPLDESTLSGRRPDPVGSKAPVAIVANAAAAEMKKISAKEQAEALPVSLPVAISGKIGAEGDADDFRFSAKAGEQWILEVNAARMKSPLDSKIEVLTADGKPIERVRLQAVRDSWFTFRGKNSSQVTDFRVHNWREMELNEYLYCNGEVVKLWLYPRGPDSGYTVYPGFGNRHNYFGTSGLAHALGEPCYVVEPIPAGAEPQPNGLPVYTILYENDDDPQRRLGNDSKMTFTAPADGEYLARISDVRSFGGDDFNYTLTIRPPKPDFKVKLEGVDQKSLAINPGGGKEFTVKVDRFDDFDGEIRIDVKGLPPGFSASTPITIEAGQHQAAGVINLATDAGKPAPAAAGISKLTATAMIRGTEVTKEIGTFGELKFDETPAKLFVEILPDGDSGDPKVAADQPMELTIHPGETISATIKATRIDFEDRIEFGKEESGRNLAHGLIVDNIGLNGLMIPVGKSEQRFFITAADWVPDSTRWIFLRTNAAGKHATRPIRLHVKQK